MTSIKEVADSRFVTKQTACLVGTSTEPEKKAMCIYRKFTDA